MSIAALAFGASVGVAVAASLHVYSYVIVAQSEFVIMNLTNQTVTDYFDRLVSLENYLHPIYSSLFIGFVIWGLVAIYCNNPSGKKENGLWIPSIIGALAYIWAMGTWMLALQV